MVSKPGSGRFAFVDAGEAARLLGIDRVMLDQWVRDGRLKPRRGVGREAFFRTSEVEALYNELHPSAELAEAVAADERESEDVEEKGPVRKKQDHRCAVPRLQADAKWYDISEDIRTWFSRLRLMDTNATSANAHHQETAIPGESNRGSTGRGRKMNNGFIRSAFLLKLVDGHTLRPQA
jgi:hypothetical protein